VKRPQVVDLGTQLRITGDPALDDFAVHVVQRAVDIGGELVVVGRFRRPCRAVERGLEVLSERPDWRC